ncbi:MAG TPA: glycosyltransferase family 9 protein [Planctomycetota bacterium]|nr:glycosyltransferase family 9 protein [Planctomycetota bacterium]
MTKLPERVLIVRTGAIGDVANALVVANAIREAAPATRVGWVAHELVQPLLEGHPSVDRVHLWPRASGLAGLRALRGELRAERYGLALDLQRIAKSVLVARLSGAPRVVGFDRARSKELAWLWPTERLAPRPDSRHRVEGYLDVVQHLGLPIPRVLHRLPQDARAAAWADQQVAAWGGAPVLVHVGATKPPNRWPAERFGGLAGALARDPGAPVVLVGGPDEVEAARRAMAAAGSAVRDLVGATDLSQLIELCRRARLVVSADSGPMHVAAAVGTRVLALFGPADPAATGPWGAQHRVLRAPRLAMDELPVKPVLTTARELLTETAAPERATIGEG